MTSEARCPCGSGESLSSCCGRFLSEHSHASTALQLMRSRFTAFSMGSHEYLLRTWHPSTRPQILELDVARHWYRLDVMSSTRGGPFDTEGTVLFEAFYRNAAGSGSQRENSRFVRERGQWFYVSSA